MAKNRMMDKVLEEYNGDMYDTIVEVCGKYEDFGDLLVDCLEWFGGSGGWDDKAADFLEEIATACYEDMLDTMI